MNFNNDAIAVYSEFRSQLAELKQLNDSVVFDYDDPKQNKEARSHCAKLRKVKAAIEDRRKSAKAYALEYGRLLDGHAKELTSEVDNMINVHMLPITAIEIAEKERLRAIEDFFAMLDAYIPNPTVEQLEGKIKQVNDYAVTADVFRDRFEFAVYRKDQAIEQLKIALSNLRTQIAEREELLRLRAEKEREERLKAEEQERLKKQAEEQARKEYEQRLAQERAALEQARIEREHQQKRMEHERQRLAQERAKLEQEQAEKAAQEQAEKERAQNKKHKSEVNNRLLNRFIDFGIAPSIAHSLLSAIINGDIDNIKVNY